MKLRKAQKEQKKRNLAHLKHKAKRMGRKLLCMLTPPLVSLSLSLSPAQGEKPKPEPPASVKEDLLKDSWSGGECIFDKEEWSITYKTDKKINGKKEVKLNLDELDGVGTPEKIACGDDYSYLITPTHALVTLGGTKAFEEHDALGTVGDELVTGNIIGRDISLISKRGILMSLVVFNKVDRLYLFTQFGKLWEVPLTSSENASCAFTAKYPPLGNMALTTYKGLVVLVKEGDENIVIIESTKDKFRTLCNETEEWVKGDISVVEKKDFLKISIGEKEYKVKVGEKGNAATAVVEEDNVYKEKD